MSTTRTPTSSTASAANGVTPATDKHGKAGKPDLYDGDRTKTDTWLLQLDLYFHCSGKEWEDKDKVILAATYMRGKAAQWIGPYLTSYLNEENTEDDQVDEIIESYTNFRDRLKQLFGIANKVLLAERAIEGLRQSRSAADYAAEFEQYAVQTKWEDEALMVMYKQGLKRFVREELLRSGAAIRNLKELYEESIRIDVEWYELNQELRRNPQNRPSFRYQRPMDSHRATPAPRKVQRNSYGYAPMEDIQFNHMRREKGKGTSFHKPGPRDSDGSRSKTTETRTCFTCGKPGHIARNCRSKNKVYRPQLNVLTIDDTENDEEWQVIPAMEQLRIKKQQSSQADLSSSRLYEDPGEYSTECEDTHEEIPRLPTPYPQEQHENLTSPNWTPNFGAAEEVPEVWKYLEPCQSEDDDSKSKTGERTDRTPVSTTSYPRRTTLISKIQRKWADSRYTHQPVDKSYAVEQSDYEPQYNLDHRNPTHKCLRWAYCEEDSCSIHYRAKEEHNSQPRRKPRCRWEWFDCPIARCDEHLWDKRKTSYFPHLTYAINQTCAMLVNGRCTQPTWHMCLHPECLQHKDLKQENGFANNPRTATTALQFQTIPDGEGEASLEPRAQGKDNEQQEGRRVEAQRTRLL